GPLTAPRGAHAGLAPHLEPGLPRDGGARRDARRRRGARVGGGRHARGPAVAPRGAPEPVAVRARLPLSVQRRARASGARALARGDCPVSRPLPDGAPGAWAQKVATRFRPSRFASPTARSADRKSTRLNSSH